MKMPEEDMVRFAAKFVEILDSEPKNRMIVVSIGGGRRHAASGGDIRLLRQAGQGLQDSQQHLGGEQGKRAPKMGYSMGVQKKEILKIQAEGKDKTVAQIAGQLHKTRGMNTNTSGS